MRWRLFRELSLEEFKKIYKIFNIKFDSYSGEFDAHKRVPKIMKELKDKGLLTKSDGALIIDLKKYNLGVSIIEKSDGTTTYMVRDIAAAIRRYEKYKYRCRRNIL